MVALLTSVFLVQTTAAQLNATLPDLGDPAQSELSPAQERRIGEEALREIRQDSSYLDDPELESYLSTLGNRLVAAAKTQSLDFVFVALRDPSINAFAMPGGVIGVHSGLVLTAQSESELASVLAHEIGHIEQRHMVRMLSKQGSALAMVLASLLVAVLAGRNSGQAAEAAIVAGQAAAIQSTLSYSRDFEREADRIGLQILDAAGFDTQGMPSFFGRLLRTTRMVENNAPSYLRTHPLTAERIADIEARVKEGHYRQAADSIDFTLLRAKLDAARGTPEEAVARLVARDATRQQDQAARWYGLARAYLAARNLGEAEKSLARLRELKLRTPMVTTLEADLARAQDRPREAARMCHDAIARYPAARYLVYCEADAWLAAGDGKAALKAIDDPLKLYTQDYRLRTLQARAHTALGNTAQAHRAQAEVYALQGDLLRAIDQLQLAQRSGGGDYMEQAAIDARLRELRAQRKEMLGEKADKEERQNR